MREVCELRVIEEYAPLIFARNEGKLLGDSVRKVSISTSDPRFPAIGDLNLKIQMAQDRSFFYGWKIRRDYTNFELEEASVFSLELATTFEPCGEECGTIYDESVACQICNSGAKQKLPFYLNTKRIPKGKEICRTIAGEIVISRRIFELFRRHKITGIEMQKIRTSSSSSAESEEWFQLMSAGAKFDVAPSTQFGIDPFDFDVEGKYRCKLGDLLGLNLISEISVKSGSGLDADFIWSRQFVGIRSGLLRPEPMVLVSRRVRNLIGSEKISGVRVQVAHVI